MSSILSKFNADKIYNFWEVNPEFKNIKIYKDFKATDHTKNYIQSSRIMWAIAFFIEREDNRFIRASEEERKELIIEEIVKSVKGFKWEKYANLIEYWKKENKTALERQLEALENYMDKRTILLADSADTITLENLKLADEAINRTTGLAERISKLRAMVLDEQSGKGEVHGGRKESLSEQGLLLKK